MDPFSLISPEAMEEMYQLHPLQFIVWSALAFFLGFLAGRRYAHVSDLAKAEAKHQEELEWERRESRKALAECEESYRKEVEAHQKELEQAQGEASKALAECEESYRKEVEAYQEVLERVREEGADVLTAKREPEYREGSYFARLHDGSEVGPICPHCYQDDGVINLLSRSNRGARCSVCGKVYAGSKWAVESSSHGVR